MYFKFIIGTFFSRNIVLLTSIQNPVLNTFKNNYLKNILNAEFTQVCLRLNTFSFYTTAQETKFHAKICINLYNRYNISSSCI